VPFLKAALCIPPLDSHIVIVFFNCSGASTVRLSAQRGMEQSAVRLDAVGAHSKALRNSTPRGKAYQMACASLCHFINFSPITV
jgi:hypothetical protein